MEVQRPIEPPSRKRSSITRLMMPFWLSKNSSPTSSLKGSPRSSIDATSRRESQPRLLRKSKSSKSLSKTASESVVVSNPPPLPQQPNKLRKPSTQPSKTMGDTRDKVTGELKDPTNMLHTLAHDFEAPKLGKQPIFESGEPAIPVNQLLSKLPTTIWTHVFQNLDLVDQAALFLTAKPLQKFLDPLIFRKLNDPDHFRARCDFLYRLNYTLPDHLLCYVCARYHRRTQIGSETLRPTNIANPIFVCPYATANDPQLRMSRHRITFGRAIPFSFVQLAMRYHHHGPAFGIPYDDLSRRYRDKEAIGNWNHQTRYAVIDDHLFMRVVSFAFCQPNLPPAGMRHLLYSREDFVPYFSVCAHWRDGNLMPSCKCGLSHVPAPLEGSGVLRVAKEVEQRLKGPKSNIVTMCETCKPLRRCPECPTEYLIEVRVQEDRFEKDPTKTFKHAIVVTRWSDLGDGSAPWSREWAAVQGDLDALEKEERFDSFDVLGRRAISGTFESFFNPEQIPPQRLISMNPDGLRLGEKGHNWY